MEAQTSTPTTQSANTAIPVGSRLPTPAARPLQVLHATPLSQITSTPLEDSAVTPAAIQPVPTKSLAAASDQGPSAPPPLTPNASGPQSGEGIPPAKPNRAAPAHAGKSEAPASLEPPNIAMVTAYSPNDSSPDEAALVNEVGALWKTHAGLQTTAHKTRGELKAIRLDLGKRLHELKSVLSRPGRGGAWSSFLESQQIPRSSADRLVRAHERTLTPGGENRTNEQISDTPEVVIRRYLQGLWPRLSRILATPESVELFVVMLRETAERSLGSDTCSVTGGSIDVPAQGSL